MKNLKIINKESTITITTGLQLSLFTSPIYFINKTAPASKVKSLLNYTVTFIGEIKDGLSNLKVKVLVPVTSLCPCSKKISSYGAHNQRSHVTVTVSIKDFIWIEEIIDIVEKEASSELYALLKRQMKNMLQN